MLVTAKMNLRELRDEGGKIRSCTQLIALHPPEGKRGHRQK